MKILLHTQTWIELSMIDKLVKQLSPRIIQQDPFFAKAFRPDMKVAITLINLATGQN